MNRASWGSLYPRCTLRQPRATNWHSLWRFPPQLPKNRKSAGNFVDFRWPRLEWNQKRDTAYERQLVLYRSFVRLAVPYFIHWVRKGGSERITLVVAIVGGMVLAYVVTHLETVPETGRIHFVALTPDEEKELGLIGYQTIVRQAMAEYALDTNLADVQFVSIVAEDIIRVSNRPDFEWEVHVIESPELNAFVLPGGKIFVFSGLLPVLKNEDGLAFVIGHEVSHVLARHAAEQLTMTKFLLLLNDVLATGRYVPWILSTILGQLGTLAFSRKMESEADYIGLKLVERAKYNIHEAPKALYRLSKANSKAVKPIEYLSTHPPDEKRIAKLLEWMHELEQKKIPKLP